MVRRLLDRYEEMWRSRVGRMADLLAEDAPPAQKETDR
jgi:hypothetical protein